MPHVGTPTGGTITDPPNRSMIGRQLLVEAIFRRRSDESAAPALRGRGCFRVVVEGVTGFEEARPSQWVVRVGPEPVDAEVDLCEYAGVDVVAGASDFDGEFAQSHVEARFSLFEAGDGELYTECAPAWVIFMQWRADGWPGTVTNEFDGGGYRAVDGVVTVRLGCRCPM
jgi:hypothetical protein